MQRQIALFAIPIFATLWAAGLGVMAARRKDAAGRVLCGALALAGAVLAAATWYLLNTAFAEGLR